MTTVLILIAFQAPAQAFWHDMSDLGVSCGDLTQADFVFETDPLWTNSLRNRVTNGFNDWLVPKRPDGNPAFSRAGTLYTVRWRELDPSRFAETICAGVHLVTFNTLRYDEYVANTLSLRGVAAHEFGHAFALNHSQFDPADLSGKTSSGAWLREPSMGTCIAPASAAKLATLSQDDEAAVMYTVDVQQLGSDEWRGVSANSSFERDLTYWRRLGGGSATAEPGGHVGTKYVRWLGQNVSMSNTTRYIPLDQEGGSTLLGGSGITFRAESWIHWDQPTDTGAVRITFRIRGVNYEDLTGNDCEYPDNRDGTWEDLNNVSANVSPWQAFINSCIPTVDAWIRCERSPYTPTDGFDAYDVEIRLRNERKDASGAPTFALADWARVTVIDANEFTH